MNEKLDLRRGLMRVVLDVHRLKKGTAGMWNYVLSLACGHRVKRHLWRDCNKVPCTQCLKPRKP